MGIEGKVCLGNVKPDSCAGAKCIGHITNEDETRAHIKDDGVKKFLQWLVDFSYKVRTSDYATKYKSFPEYKNFDILKNIKEFNKGSDVQTLNLAGLLSIMLRKGTAHKIIIGGVPEEIISDLKFIDSKTLKKEYGFEIKQSKDGNYEVSMDKFALRKIEKEYGNMRPSPDLVDAFENRQEQPQDVHVLKNIFKSFNDHHIDLYGDLAEKSRTQESYSKKVKLNSPEHAWFESLRRAYPDIEIKENEKKQTALITIDPETIDQILIDYGKTPSERPAPPPIDNTTNTLFESALGPLAREIDAEFREIGTTLATEVKRFTYENGPVYVKGEAFYEEKKGLFTILANMSPDISIEEGVDYFKPIIPEATAAQILRDLGETPPASITIDDERTSSGQPSSPVEPQKVDELPESFQELSTLTPKTQNHTVKKGESLSVIAKKYKIDLDILYELNPKINKKTSMIRTG